MRIVKLYAHIDDKNLSAEIRSLLQSIDFSEPHFAKAKEQIGKESSHKNARIEKVNLMEPLPFPENHFDSCLGRRCNPAGRFC
jgi:hypothetical protein